jgi:MFS family permease
MTEPTSSRGSPAAHRPRLRTFAALRHRNYRLFFAGQLISVTGTWMQNMALSYLTYHLTNSAFLLGLISTVGSLPMLLFALPGGVLADRLEKRRILLFTQSSVMVLAFILAALTWAQWIRVWQIALIAAVAGTAMAADMPTRQAFVIEMVDRRDLMNAIALNSSIFNSARIAGPSIAGILYGMVGPGWCFFANGASFIAVLTGLLLMRFPPRARRQITTSPLADALDGIRHLRQKRTVLGIAIWLAAFSVFGWSYAVLMPIFARDVLHMGPSGLGYLMTGTGVGALIGALGVATLSGYNVSRPTLLFSGAFLLAAALIAFSFSRAFWLSAAMLALAGMGGVTFMSTANTTIQVSVPDELRGRMMGVWGVVFAGSAPLGSLQAGTMAQYLGAPMAVLIGALVTICATVMALVALRRRRGAAEQ